MSFLAPASRSTRWALFAAGVIGVSALAIWAASSFGDDGAGAPGWDRYDDPDDGFSVSYPETWNRAERVLTPALEDPREILVLGTGPLPAGGDECAQYPENAIEALDPGGALVTIQETGGPLGGRHTIDRPQHFDLSAGYESDAVECLAEDHSVSSVRMIPFRDGDRSFYAIVALGRSAPAGIHEEARGILDTLVFE